MEVRRVGPVRSVVALVLVAVMAVVAACTGPARDAGTYTGKAATTVDEVQSAVQVAILGIESATRHDLQAAYVSTLLAEAEESATSAEATLASIQPPDAGSDRVRARSLEVIGTAVDRLAVVRIEARRGSLDVLARHLPGLRRDVDRLTGLAEDLRRGP